ncbi:VOC family protein [Streptomyces violaceusniger]|uniref:Glyoxalase/bleomycin resistance protein/dioxygenase n=1 Tax=Streptomyces violaceusniger (strain Tu 4113) TaxID=653045 RepID=G2NVT5_STRV4|nr:VOC family protein [Streptomyces violaceusniger]AEM86176.1 Glyoxalase/bleomycin resistance protein/dioxygenase [Streptomyces violaceusniger Tu 4113]
MNTAPNQQQEQQKQPKQPRDPAVWPTLQAHDAIALIDFLVDTVGFLRTAVYQDEDRVAHAQLDWPEGGGIMLGSYDPATKSWCLEPGTFGAYVVTEHVDALYERLTAAGVRVLRPIEDQPYGSREFAIADPEGNKWSFGTYRGEPRPAE